MIVDLALAGLGALALYRGYRRGFLRGAAVLAAAAAGAFLAFRVSGPGGSWCVLGRTSTRWRLWPRRG